MSSRAGVVRPFHPAGILLLSLALGLARPVVAADAQGGGAGAGAAPVIADGTPIAAVIEPLPVKAYCEPVELVRTLQLIQDRIAQGSAQAHVGQRALIAHAEERMFALDPEIWRDESCVRAAVTFGLSGGGPNLLRHLMAQGTLPDGERPLVLGSLAYLEGREREARSLLVKIDPLAMPPSLGGQLALTQAALAARDDQAQSIRLLDLARLLAPGTLVEEGALRREIFVLAQTRDAVRFEALSIQYLRRFRRSVYAGNFRQRFAAALTRLDFASDGARFARLEAMLDEIEPEGRRDVYLLIARAGLEQGKISTAVFAAERSITLTEPGSVDAARARLYRAAALIVADGRFEESVETLRTTDRGALPPSDADLLDRALSTAREIRDVPVRIDPAPAVTVAAPGSIPGPVAATIARAKVSIDQIDEMMRRSER